MAKQKDTFPKIAAESTVKRYSRTGDGINIVFTNLRYRDAQRELIDKCMDNNIKVRVTIEAVEANLPME